MISQRSKDPRMNLLPHLQNHQSEDLWKSAILYGYQIKKVLMQEKSQKSTKMGQ